MTQPANSRLLNQSRLVRFLTDLDLVTTQNHPDFSQRLGQLIDFSDSIILSAAHGELPGAAKIRTERDPELRGEKAAAVKDVFLRVRGALVQSIVKSTSPNNATARIKLPVPGESVDPQALLTFEPYHRFYLLQQRDMELKIQHLRLQMRESMADISPGLAQLAVLDRALGDTLAVHIRRFMAVIPTLLEKRFTYFLAKGATETKIPDDSLNQNIADRISGEDSLLPFYREIQGLLLAELDVRMQPLIGLLEALNQEVETH